MIRMSDTLLDCDAKSFYFISEALLKNEVSLYEEKWWDYKPLHPLQATYLFAESYKAAVKRFISKRKCLFTGMNYKGLKNDDFLECSRRVITGLWKARQAADSLGIPYDFYCNNAMKYADVRNYTYVPNPTQLYSIKSKFKNDLSMLEFIALEWEKENKVRLFHAKSGYYSIDANRTNRYWIQHQRYLLKKVQERASMRHVLIANLCFDKRLLDKDMVIEKFDNGLSLMESAMRYHKLSR